MKSKFLTAVLSVLIAFVLWSYVVTVEAPESKETYYNVPVVLDGIQQLEERSLMIISDKDLRVNLTLSGYRTDLRKLNSGNITLMADLSQITEPGVHELNYTVSYPGGNQTGAIDVLNKDPQWVTLTVAERSRKEVPVKVICTGSVAPGYTADRQNVLLDHTTVTVFGPKDVVDQISEARINIDLTDSNKTITQTFPHVLCDDRGVPVENITNVTTNVSNIQATVKILRLKEVPLKLHVIPGGGITEEMATITMDRDSIIVSGSDAALEGLEQITLGTIDLGKLTENTVQRFTISLPDGVTNVTGVNVVYVEIQMPELQTRTFTVTVFEKRNVPNGATVELLTEQLQVRIRGPVMLLDALQPENIVAVVDLSDAQPGIGIYKADIQIRGMEGVGAVGSDYLVNAELLLPQEQPEG